MIMNFLEAVKHTNDTKQYVRRRSWSDGIAMFIANPNGRNDTNYKYAKAAQGSPYIATCHVAACEMGGVRDLEDILADDWELYYK
jgi:hypothetical protein